MYERNDKFMKLNKKTKQKIAIMLSSIILFGNLTTAEKSQKTKAASPETTVRDINLNINGTIAGITTPTSTDPDTATQWEGSRIYYAGILFRVLDPKTREYNEKETMFLQADSTLTNKPQYSSSVTNYLTSSDKDGFWYSFSNLEKEAIVNSTKLSLDYGETEPVDTWTYSSITDKTAFVLDGVEASNHAYGYSNAATRKMTGATDTWWLRSGCGHAGATYDNTYITADGTYAGTTAYGVRCGIAPAMNLDLSKILFAHVSNKNLEKSQEFIGTFSNYASTNLWKLTLKDGDTSFSVNGIPDYAKPHSSITVNVTNPGSGTYTQTSALLSAADGTVVAYGKIGDTSIGNKTFTIPSVGEGTYTLLIFNEQVNSYKQTDYASNVVKKTITISNSAITTPTPTPIPSTSVSSAPGSSSSPTITKTPKVLVSTNSAKPGDTDVPVTVSLKDIPQTLSTIIVDLHFNNGALYPRVISAGELGRVDSSQGINHVRLIWNKMDGENLEGKLATIYFNVAEKVADEKNLITVTASGNTSSSENVEFQCTNGSITVSSSGISEEDYLPGDVNHDGKVNTKDATLIIQYYAGWDIELDLTASDVTGDGKVNTKDATLINQYYAGWDVKLKGGI